MINLYKDGENMAIVTDCIDEREFLGDMAVLLEGMIIEGQFMVFKTNKPPNKEDIENGCLHACDWADQLRAWLPQIVEICCKYRGYKAEVQQQILYSTGSQFIQMEPCASIGNLGGKPKISKELQEFGDKVWAETQKEKKEEEELEKEGGVSEKEAFGKTYVDKKKKAVDEEGKKIKCSVKDGKRIKRRVCLDYSSDNIDECEKCIEFEATRKILLEV